MQEGTIQRVGEGETVMVKLEDGGEELWRAAMTTVPRKDEFVYNCDTGALYKVKKVRWEFDQPEGAIVDPAGNAIPTTETYHRYGVVVTVSPV